MKLSTVSEFIVQGDKLVSEGNLEDANKLYKVSIETFPDSAALYYKLGEVALAQKKLQKAYQYCSQSLALQPKFHWAYYGIAQTFVAQGKLLKAIQNYKTALEIEPDELLICQRLGEALVMSNQLQESEAYFRKSIELDPNFHWAYYRLGQVLYRLNRGTESLAAFRRVKELKPHFKLVDQYLLDESQQIETSVPSVSEQGKSDENKQEKEVNLDASDVNHLRQKADQLFDLGRYSEALSSYEVALKLKPKGYHLMLRTAECQIKVKRYAEAETLLIQLLEDHGKNHLWPIICLGNASLEQGKYESAISYFEKATAIDNQNIWAWNLLGQSYQAVYQSQKAIGCYEKIVKIAPKKSIGHLGIAALYKDLKKKEKAEFHWKKAIELEPKNQWPYISLGYLYLDSDELDQAEIIFTQALELFPEAFEVVFAAAHIYIKKRDWNIASKMIEEALSIAPERYEARVRLLELYCYSGDLKLAQQQLNLLKDISGLPKSYYQAAAKLYSELGQWDEAFEAAGLSIASEPKNVHNHRLFLKLTHKTKKYEQALKVIEECLGVHAEEDLSQLLLLKSSILEHLLYSLEEARECIQKVTIDNLVEEDLKIISRRLKIKENIFSQSLKKSHQFETAFFYCTDKGYALPTLVSIYSLYKHNKGRLNNQPIYVAADSSTLELITPSYKELSQNLGIELKLIDINAIFQDLSNHSLVTNYGVFSGGESLSSTAYYRLFFARYFDDFNSVQRWLYIDSDTVILNSLEEIDTLSFADKPIAARHERSKPEIMEAIKVNNLTSNRYYNSGVLGFNSAHPQLNSLLDEAIRISIEEGDRLLYHDQCALNIAFDGHIAELPAQFNDFYPPSDERTLDQLIITDESCIVHLLDRPKPWYTLSAHRGSVLWFKVLEEMSTYISADHLTKLFNTLQSSV